MSRVIRRWKRDEEKSDITDPVSSLDACEPRPSAASTPGKQDRDEAPAAVGDDGEWSDGVLTVVDAVLSGRDMLSLRSSDNVGF